MCGIIGYTGRKNAVPVLISGLHSLEYRGYDSAGIAVMDGGAVTCVKAKGRIANVESLLESRPHELSSHTGIGHTRWATHGVPSDENSHPHGTELVYAVHNGIIENYAELRERLAGLGYRFRSETDTEAAVCLIDYHYRQTGDPKEALAAATRELRGSWALGVLFADRDGELYAVRHENPLVAASDETGSYIASDITALLEHTDRYIRLDEDEIAVLCADGIRVYGADGAPVEKEVQTVTWNRDAARRGGFPHYMLKEIHEEPETIRKTVGAGTRGGFPDFGAGNVDMAALDRAEHIYIVACGTAMHAGLIGKQLIERFSGIPVSVEIASEFRYGAPIVSENDLFIAISQSGETADTLAALRLAKSLGMYTLSIVNVVGSSVARESDGVIYTCAGPEIAVASTKAYIVQLSVLYLLAAHFGFCRGRLSEREVSAFVSDLKNAAPDAVASVIARAEELKAAAETIKGAEDIFYIGRGADYFLAEEASLKLKEVSYIHSEAYPAGELKHGTISLITDGVPVIAIANTRELHDKMINNIREVRARGAYVLLLCGADFPETTGIADTVIRLPALREELMPLPTATAFQLLAYYTSVLRGCDVDKPRNLAKSVTVE
ncbi:MAG: glutamine--fructose-6-phosphate transaminase (isomerizing) [Clostridiales bacterium]|nr:glutamine--fructose-6-phosphate transaminase (isomerizing) [Clostridiales bacterium]